jgi:hypothetical protein
MSYTSRTTPMGEWEAARQPTIMRPRAPTTNQMSVTPRTSVRDRELIVYVRREATLDKIGGN